MKIEINKKDLKQNISQIIDMLKAGYCLPYNCEAWNKNKTILKELSETDYRGEYLLHIACKQKAFDLVKTLVINGADVNKSSRTFGTTPIQIAFKKNDFKTVYLLYQYGANIYYINDPYRLNHPYNQKEENKNITNTMQLLGAKIYDVKYYAQTKKAKKLFSLLDELEKNKANVEVISEIEKLCV